MPGDTARVAYYVGEVKMGKRLEKRNICYLRNGVTFCCEAGYYDRPNPKYPAWTRFYIGSSVKRV